MGQRGRPRHPDVLTPREQDVLSLIREGLTNEQIAERLGITFETAKHHVSEIISKLGVETREEAAAWREERRWSHGRIALGAAGVGVIAATIAGLALLAWGVSRSGEGDGAVATPNITVQPTPTNIPRPVVTVVPQEPSAAEIAACQQSVAELNEPKADEKIGRAHV